MTTIERETEALDRMKLEAEIGRLTAENNRLRGLLNRQAETLRKITASLPPESLV